MKEVHVINKWAYCITLALYLTVYLGLLAQIVLGVLQVILAIYLLIRYRKDTIAVNMLGLYALFTLFYFFVALALRNSKTTSDLVVYLFLMVLPMSIGAYFLYITFRLNKKYTNHEIQHS